MRFDVFAVLAATIATATSARISDQGWLADPTVCGGMLAVVVLLMLWADLPLPGVHALPDEGEPAVANGLSWLARLALGLLVVCVPLAGSFKVLDTYDLPKQTASTVLQAALLVAWCAARVTGRRAPRPLAPLAAYGSVLLLLSAVVSVWPAVNRFIALQEVGRLTLGVATLLVVHDLARDAAFARRLLALAGATATCVAAVAFAQYLGHDIPGFPQVFAPAACFGNRSMASGYLALVLPVALGGMLWSRARVAALAAGAAAVLLAFVIGVSRPLQSDLPAFVPAALLLGGYLGTLLRRPKALDPEEAARERRGRSARLALVTAALVVAAALVQNQLVLARAFAPTTVVASELARIRSGEMTWHKIACGNSVAMLAESGSRALTGVGAANWQFLYPLYHRAWRLDEAFDTKTQAQTLHNDFLQYAAELGVPGTLALIALVLSLALCLPALYRDLPGEWGVLGLTAAAGAAAVFLDALISYPFKLACPSLMFWIFLALAHRAAREVEHTAPDTLAAPAWRAPALLLAALLGGHTLAGWAISDLKSSTCVKRAYELSYQKRWPEACVEFLEGAELMPWTYNTYLLLGRAYYTTGKLPEAVAANLLAARYHPNHCNVYYNLANCYRDMGRHDESARAFAQSSDLYPGNEDAWIGQAHELTEAKKTEEALACWQRARVQCPRSQDVLCGLASLLVRLNRGQEAIAVLKNALVEHPEFEKAHQALGNAYTSSEQVPEALREYQAAVAVAPDYVEALNNLAGTYWKMHVPDEAIRNFKRAIALKPDFSPAYFGLADVYYNQQNLEEAFRAYTRFLELWRAEDGYAATARKRLEELKTKASR